MILDLSAGNSPFDTAIVVPPGTLANPSVQVGGPGQGFYSTGTGGLSVALSGVRLAFPVLGATGTIMAAATAPSSNGLIGATRLPLIHGKNSDGTTLSASASSGKFGITLTAGTSEKLTTEAANSNTKTDVVVWEMVLPAGYIAGTDITVTANCNYTLGAGTVGTHTLAMAAYLCADAGTQGSTIIATAAQTVPAAAGEVTFTITGTTLTPGARLMLAGTLVIQDTGGSNITATINSVRLS